MSWFENIYYTSGWYILLNESTDEYKSWRALYKIANPDCSISYAQCNVSFFLHYLLQETKEVNKSSLNIYRNIVYRLLRRRQKSAKAAVDIRVVAKPEYKLDQSILSHSICNKALLIVVPGGVKSATNRKASWGSSESLNNFAVFIMAAYSRVLQGAKNQLGTVEVCLLSANGGLFLVQWNTIK